MAYDNLWFAVLAVIQCSVFSCYTWNYQQKYNPETNLEKFEKFLNENQGLGVLIGTAVDIVLLALFFCCLKLFCPTCCTKRRQGIILNATSMDVREVQPLMEQSRRIIDFEMKCLQC